MSMIFISHSRHNNEIALEIRDWLHAQGWSEVFLDLDPEQGMAPGQLWVEALRKAGAHCAAMLVLVSPEWVASPFCQGEFSTAHILGKKIFPVIVSATPSKDIPPLLSAHYQYADLSSPEQKADGYERLRIGLHRAGLNPHDFPWPPAQDLKRSPYRGLSALDTVDAPVFFGREAAIIRGLDALRMMRNSGNERIMVILGASGAGKSSFLRAGLLARLERDTENVLVLPIMRPQRTALTGHSGLLAALKLNPCHSAQDLLEDHPLLAGHFAELRQPVYEYFERSAQVGGEAYRRKKLNLILAIDQGEELFHADIGAEQEQSEARQSLQLIARALEADPDLQIIITIRSDSYAALQSSPELQAFSYKLFDLPGLAAAVFKDVIEGPARLADPPIHIDPALTEQLLKDLSAADALPLLAFTLERLVRACKDDHHVKLHDYEEGLGGLQGTIEQAIQAALRAALRDDTLPDDKTELLQLTRRAFIPWLVRLEEVNASAKRRSSTLNEMPSDARPLLTHFINQRLLVSSQTGTDHAVIEVAHEAVLRHWDRLDDWIKEEAEKLVQIERLLRAVQEWQESHKQNKSQDPHFLIHKGERLQQARTLLQEQQIGETHRPAAVDYLKACHDQEQRTLAGQRRLQRVIFATSLAVLVVSLVGLWYVIDGNRNLVRSQSRTLAAAAQQLLKQGDYWRGVQVALVAARDEWLAPAAPEARVALASGAQGLGLVMRLDHPGSIAGVSFSNDERRILSWAQDGAMRLWDLASGMPIGVPMQHDYRVDEARFSSDGRRILSWAWDNRVRLWDAATGLALGVPMQHDEHVNGAILSSDGQRVLSWSDDNTVRLWSADSGLPIGQSMSHDDAVWGALFSSDEQRILSWSNDGTVRLWDAATGSPLGNIMVHDDRVGGARFSNDGQRILSWAWDGSIRLWDGVTGDPIEVAIRQDSSVLGVHFSSGEDVVLSWSSDGAIQLWDIARGKPIATLQHDAYIEGVAFSKDEQVVLSWGDDGTVRLWEAASGAPIGPPMRHDSTVMGAVFSKDEARILSWSDDGTVRLWDAATGLSLIPPMRHEGVVLGAVFSRDEQHILSWSRDATARLWDAATAKLIGAPMRHDSFVAGAQFSGDERRILTWSQDGTVRLWDATASTPGSVPLGASDISGAQLSSDGQYVLSWDNAGSLHVRDVVTDELIGAPMQHDGLVLGAAFSPDQQSILSWSDDGAVRLWDVATSAPRAAAMRHVERVLGASFSSDSHRVLSVSGDGAARIWDAATGTLMAERYWPLAGSPGLREAMLSSDQRALILQSRNAAFQYDISWIMDNAPISVYVQKICAQKLKGNELEAPSPYYPEQKVLQGVQHLDAKTTDVAPLLRGREAENVCAWHTPWYDSWLRYGIGWLFSD